MTFFLDILSQEDILIEAKEELSEGVSFNNTRLLHGKAVFVLRRVEAGRETEVDTDTQRGLKTAFLMVVLVCAFCSAAFGQPWAGNGIEGDPYQIWTAEDMQAIGADSNYWSAHFKLMADIDLSAYTGTSFNIIGVQDNPFTGVFDGNGHRISNFSYSCTGILMIGIFGLVDGPGAEIRDLGLINPNVNAGNGWVGGLDVGSLVGLLKDGTVGGCYVDGGSVSGIENVGGLVGSNSSGAVITDCHSSCSVSGEERVGGLAGVSYSIVNSYSTGSVSGGEEVGGLVGSGEDTISNCYAAGSVSGSMYVGGLAGSFYATITNCYSTASVLGDEYVGGIAGVAMSIVNSYSTGSVSGTTEVGGLVAHAMSIVDNSFWDIQTSGQSTSGAGTGLTTVQMKDPNTYIYWGCGPSWTIDPGVDYPHLIWENQAGEIIPSVSLSDFVEGDGSETNPYLIYTAEQLNQIGLFYCEWDKHFKLMADVNLAAYTGTSFNIIGTDGIAFSGVFDGNGYTISNFTYSVTEKLYIAMFGVVSGIVKDLGLVNPNVLMNDFGWSVGSLVGACEGGTISGCFVDGGSILGESAVGGLVGEVWTAGVITNCYATSSVSGAGTAGGLVGIGDGTISNCYAGGSVSTTYGQVGGLVGRNYATITNCYATGSVSGDDGVGGLVGVNWRPILNCYSTGSVTGTTNVGGLVGYGSGAVSHCFWDIQTSGQATSNGGTGKTTAEMQDINTFLEAGWDFLGETANGTCNYWQMPVGGGYPVLSVLNGYIPAEPFGSGTEEAPYIIADANDLGTIWYRPSAYYILANDIDLAEIRWSMAVAPVFRGIFDGNGHTISNFAVDCNGTDYTGLFGYVEGQNTEIRDLGLVDPNVDTVTGDNVGSLAGLLREGTVTNCYVTGGSVSGEGSCGDGVGGLLGSNYATVSNCYSQGVVSGTERDAGGLIGYNKGEISNCSSAASVSGNKDVGGLVGHNEGTMRNSYATGSVSGHAYIGGFVGDNLRGILINCHSTGSASGTGDYVGGLAGSNDGTVSGCSSTGSVSGLEKVGGLVGSNHNRTGTVTNCYSSGDVTAATTVGGLVGYNYSLGTITNCYSASSVTGMGDGGGFVGENAGGAAIHNCYAIGIVSVLIGNAGGLAGLNSSEISDCFWDVETSGQSNMCGAGTGCDDGYGKTTEEMQTESTFTDAGWDFVGEVINGSNDIWYCDEPNYPQLAWEVALSAGIDMDELWMYQSLPGQGNSDLTASVSVTDDPMGNATYSYEWEILLPGDVNLAPVTVDGGGAGDAYWTFAARGCDEPGGLSDSGQTFTVRVMVTGDDYGNTGVAEAEFAISLLGDVNNDAIVNVVDRSIANVFWRLGSAGPYTLRDCDVTSDGIVNVVDRSIANAVWRGMTGQNSVSTPCPLR